MNVSVDGFINDARGSLDWSVVDDELHAWFNEHERRAAAFIYGRRLYETMTDYWPFALDDPDATDVMREFARIWQPKPKFVFSNTLESVDWNSRLLVGEVVPEVERLKSEIDGELHVAGATVAAPLVRAGMVDEFVLIVHPAVLAAGTPYFPDGNRPAALRLLETRTFPQGQVLLRYVPR
jgi:dihydrofolate reductase